MKNNYSNEPIKNAAYYLDLVEKDPRFLSDIPLKYRSAKLCKLAIKEMGYKSPAEAVKENPELFDLLHQSLIDHDVLLEYIRSLHFRQMIKCKRIKYAMSSPNYRVFYFDSVALPPEDVLNSLDLCEALVCADPRALTYIPDDFRSAALYEMAVREDSKALAYVPDEYKTYHLCLNAYNMDHSCFGSIPLQFITPEMCESVFIENNNTLSCIPKLCAMYVMKKLQGVNAVQTFSRLNRICPPYDKKVFILDFANKYPDIERAFAPFYTTTILSGTVNPQNIYDLEANVDGYAVLDPMHIQSFNEILFKQREKAIAPAERQQLTFYLQKAAVAVYQYSVEQQREIRIKMRSFVRFYEFLLQASCFKDVELHKKYIFLTYLLSYLNIAGGGPGFDLTGKLKASRFVQKKGTTYTAIKHGSQPVVKLAEAEGFNLSEQKIERLSQIIADINSRTGKSYDNDVAVKAMLQIRDILMKSEALKASAKANTENDFEFTFYDGIDDALIEGLEQNQDFFSLLLSNPELKKQVLGIFAGEIYASHSHSGF